MDPANYYTDADRQQDALTCSEPHFHGEVTNHTAIIPGSRSEGLTGPSAACSHVNPVCTCNTSDEERADLLQEYLDLLAEAGYEPLLMPIGKDGKHPIIKERCGLDTVEGRAYLVEGSEAVNRICEEGARGFFIYAGKPSHGTKDLLFADRDEPDLWPTTPETLRVISGSGSADHLTYINAGDVKGADAKDDIEGAGSIRVRNVGVVTPGSIHPTGGVYHVADATLLAELSGPDLPTKLRPRSSVEGSINGETTAEPVEIEALPGGFDADAVTNAWGASLRDVKKVSSSVDKLLSGSVRSGYTSLSEADMAAVNGLLIWGFDEADVANILRDQRNRSKMTRDEYVERTITRTALTKVDPVESAYGRALIETSTARGPLAGVETQKAVKAAMHIRGGEATVSELVDSGLIPWGDVQRRSVARRVKRTLRIFEAAGYVERTGEKRGRGGADVWRSTDLEDLSLPGEEWF